MKVLKKVALVSAIAAVSSGAQAELVALDDLSMRQTTGQAGLTIDVESQWQIGEFAYKDAGYLLIQGIRMGGNSFGNGTGTAGSYLDNLRLEVDIAGDGTNGDNELHYGFSQMRDLAQLFVDEGNADTEFADVAGGIDPNRGGLAVDDKRIYDDGDLVIHFDFTDGFQTEGGYEAFRAAGRLATDSYDDAEVMFEHAVDFRFEIDAIGLASSTYDIGSAGLDTDTRDGVDTAAPGTTTLISNLGIQGYLGPEDLHIENDGNGFGNEDLAAGEYVGDLNGDGLVNEGKADSRITWGTYFRITDLDVYIDIAGLQIQDMEIHNERGDLTGLDGTSAFGFAHSIREIYAVKDAVLHLDQGGYVDGIAINTRFKGDIDINHLSFGDTGKSIGQIFLTDVESDTRWVISAH